MLEGKTTNRNLVGRVTRDISPETIRAVAAQLGEDRTTTASAISASVPSVLAALSDVARSDERASGLADAIASKVRTTAGRPDGAAALLSRKAASGAERATFLHDVLG